ncbi:hypothetical protein ACSBOX_21510 (plasmid) [Arthrobacter sp. KN11-1C]|uniref:hypothetical protein n=1 Tax=Arthrobacter sp. KN11-1C TaxID=3445774 RepID=UPI003FA18E26
MSFQIQPDWLPLVGEVVEVRLHDTVVRQGTVDAVTSDNSILWIAADGAHTRTMMERSEGYTMGIIDKQPLASATQNHDDGEAPISAE